MGTRALDAPGKASARDELIASAFGIPASVASVDRITVQARTGTSSAASTYATSIELSGDNGATWTSVRRVLFSTMALTACTFGGAADTSGCSWTAANLGTGSFRVRITHASSTASRRPASTTPASRSTTRP